MRAYIITLHIMQVYVFSRANILRGRTDGHAVFYDFITPAYGAPGNLVTQFHSLHQYNAFSAHRDHFSLAGRPATDQYVVLRVQQDKFRFHLRLSVDFSLQTVEDFCIASRYPPLLIPVQGLGLVGYQ